MYRGWIQGFPKKLGSIHMTRLFAAGKATPRLEPGARSGATCAANDRQIARIVVTLEHSQRPVRPSTIRRCTTRAISRPRPGNAACCASAGSFTVGPVSDDVLERHHHPRDLAVVGGAGRAEARARLEPRRRLAGREQPSHVDRAELLREALNPAAVHREVLVDPDVHAAADRFAAEPRADDEEELAVLGLDRVLELVQVDRARLPVGEDRGDRARIVGRLELGRQQRRDRVRDRCGTRRSGSRPSSATVAAGRSRRARRAIAARCNREDSRRHPGASRRNQLREQPRLLGFVHLLRMPLDPDAGPLGARLDRLDHAARRGRGHLELAGVGDPVMVDGVDRDHARAQRMLDSDPGLSETRCRADRIAAGVRAPRSS